MINDWDIIQRTHFNGFCKGIIFFSEYYGWWWRWCMLSRVCLWSHGLQPARLLCTWDSPGRNTGEDCHALLSGIFLTQGSEPCLTSPVLAGRFFTTIATWSDTIDVINLFLLLYSVKRLNWGILKNVRVYLSKNCFELGSTKPEVIRSTPPTGAKERPL